MSLGSEVSCSFTWMIMMMNCLDLFSVDTKTLLSLSPVALGVLLLFYNIKSSKEENVEGAALEYPPVAPVGTIQFMRARVLPDFSSSVSCMV